MPERLRILTASSLPLERLPGKSELTPDEVRGALAALSRPASALAYLKYLDAQVPRYARILHGHVFSQLVLIAKREKWKVELGALDRFVQCVISDYLHAVCPVCRGVAAVMIGDRRQECAKCSGTGRNRVNVPDLARSLEMSPRTFYRVWRRRHLIGIDVLTILDAEIHRTIKKQLTRLAQKCM